jgi:hypothetical protein
MPTLVIAADSRLLELPVDRPEEALDQARNASSAFGGVSDVWLFESRSEAPWHAEVGDPRRRFRME